MAFTEPLDVFFSDFGEVAIWKGSVSVTVIFDNAFNLSGGILESTGPAVQVKADDVEGIAHGDAFRVRSTNYVVRGIEPDVTGDILTLKLGAQ
jgi:hypothetical protein